MISCIISDLVLDGPGTELLGLSDVDLIKVGGSWRVVVSSEAESAITVFGFDGTEITGVLDSQSYKTTSGTRTVWDMGWAVIGGDTVLLPATRYEDQTKVFTLGANGALAATKPGPVEGLGLTASVTMNGKVYVYAQRINSAELTVYLLNADKTLSEVQVLSDTANSFLGDISAMTSAWVGEAQMLFVASAYDAGLSVYLIGGQGRLTRADTVQPEDGAGFSKLSALVTAEVDGTNYVVAAAAGTSSLTVYAVSGTGKLTEVDHLIDTLDTRFQGASKLEVFDYEGRVFVVAAGSDDGITLFELRANGVLWDYGSLADTYDTTLDNISGLAVQVIGGAPVLFVSSSTDHGFTQITLDMGQIDAETIGNDTDEYLRGTSSADVINGGGGHDTLEGLGGADVLMDGDGRDILTGDGGQDVFVFTPDADLDVITDFGAGYDRIDLSAYAGVRGLSDLLIYTTGEGVMIHIGYDTLLLSNEEGKVYEADEILADSFIF